MTEQVIDERAVAVGDRVLWWPYGVRKHGVDGASGDECAAIVTGVGDNGRLDLNICTPRSTGFVTRRGVPHTDEALTLKQREVEGTWEHRPEHLEQMRQIERAETLVAEAEELGVSPAELLRQRKGVAVA